MVATIERAAVENDSAVTWIEVRCANVRNGENCGFLLFRVNADVFVSSSVEIKCERCKKVDRPTRLTGVKSET